MSPKANNIQVPAIHPEGAGGERRARVVRPRSIAALGDVTDPNCFGGSPRLFLDEARRQGFAEHAWRVDVDRLRAGRWRWNAGQVLRGRRPGGYQFSRACRSAALAQIPPNLLGTEVLSFHQHFPPLEQVRKAGGDVSFYLDATYVQLFPSYGLDRTLSRAIRDEALAYERQTLAAARRVVASQSWAFRSLLSDCKVAPGKCAFILPAPNYPVFPGLRAGARQGRAGRERPFVLGFIGKDWRRKGLPFLVQVAERLRAMGWKAVVRAIGFPAGELPADLEVESLGFIDKRSQFGPFLHSCDVGCLFSQAEAAGIAVLEFLGVGIPVAGFTVNGLADLLPREAGFRFSLGAKTDEVAEVFDRYLRDESEQERLRAAAVALAPALSWDRCVREFREYWETGTLAAPLRLCPE
jgi:glycosyltransferase involved in cell wall biosynthesis